MRNLYNGIVIITFVMSFSSCSEENKNVLSAFGEIENLTSALEAVDYPSDSINNPDYILAVRDYIIFANNNSDFLLSVYNTKDKKMVKTLSKGKGPNESLYAYSISRYNDDVIFSYDNFLNKIYLFSLDSLFNTTNYEIRPLSNFLSFGIDQELVIGTTNGANQKRFLISNVNNDSILAFDDFNKFNLTTVSGSHIFQGFSTINRADKKWAVFSFYAELCTILDYKNQNTPEIVYEKMFKEPKIEGGEENSSVFSIENTLGFTSVTSDEKFIYTLYNGKSIADIKTEGKDILLSDKLCVFDWNGKAIKCFNFDYGIKSIDYNKELNKLYCLCLDLNGDLVVKSLDVNKYLKN